METFAHELREALDSGALAQRGRVDLSDGATVDAERMARIVLADFDRTVKHRPDEPILVDDEQQLYDDLMRLHELALTPM